MMKKLFSRALIALLLTFSWAGVYAPAFAAPGNQGTTLTLEVGDPDAGQHALARARLITAEGAPVPDVMIHFLVNGQADGQARTNGDGQAEWRLRTPLGKGSYTISAIFDGTDQLAAAQADASFGVSATTLTLTVDKSPTNGATQVPVVAQLVDESGAPVADATIIFLVDGQRDGESRTDRRGRAEWRLRSKLAVGGHKAEAVFEDVPSRLGSRASASFSILATRIELQKADALSRTDPYISFTARLLLSDGTPVADAQILFAVDGTRIGTTTTDANGTATRRIKRDLAGGNHKVTAVFDGMPLLNGSRSEASFTLANTSLDIRVAPERSQGGERVPVVMRLVGPEGAPVAGARLDVLIDGQRDGQVWTDAKGEASYRIQRSLGEGSYTLSAVFAGRSDLEHSEATTPFAVNATVLTVSSEPAGPIQIGQPFTIVAQLKTRDGAPVNNGRVSLKVNGVAFNESRTNAEGKATWSLRGAPSTGTYALESKFVGLPGLLVANAQTPLQVMPAVFAVQTVPALPGVRFSLDDQEFVSNDSGLARVEVMKPGIYHLKLLSEQTTNPKVRVEFARWNDEYFVPERDVRVPMIGSEPLQIGFNVGYQVTPSFVDNTGQKLDPSRISAFTLNSSDGRAYDFTNGDPQWLEANHIVRSEQGLEVRPVLFSVRSVEVDGSNVVNQGQQRFYADSPDAWDVRVQMYSVRFLVRDGFFGWPIGREISLTYPDGQKISVPLASDGPTVVSGLARGKYDAKVSALGISNPTPFTMARDQDVIIEVLSYLDIALAAGLMALVAFGLLLIGRPSVRQAVLHPGMAMRGLSAAFGAAVGSFGSLFQRRSPVRPSPVRVLDHRQHRSWRRVIDPMTVAVTALIAFGLVGLGVAGAEAARSDRRSGGTPAVVAEAVPGERPQTKPAAPPASGQQIAPPVSPRLAGAAPTPLPTTEPIPTAAAPALVPAPTSAVPQAVPPSNQPTILSYDGTVMYKARGPKVVALQQRLHELGYFNDQVTGYFGSITQTALANFQRDRNMEPTGYPNKDTIDALNQCDASCVRGAGQG